MANTIQIDKVENRAGGSGWILTNKYHITATVSVGDSVLVANGYSKGVVTKITEKMITVTTAYGSPYAIDTRMRISTFIRDVLVVENDTFKEEFIERVI